MTANKEPLLVIDPLSFNRFIAAQAATPGYVVETNSTAKEIQSSSTHFLNSDLLTARHQAFQHAQERVRQRQTDEQLKIDIFVAEFYENQIAPKPIGCVFNYSDFLTNPAVFANITKSDPVQALAHERFVSPLAVWKNLSEISFEYDLYTTYNHPLGFGCVKLTLSGPEVSQSLPYHSFYLLHEGIAYAVSLIERYNQFYGSTYGLLRFAIKDLF